MSCCECDGEDDTSPLMTYDHICEMTRIITKAMGAISCKTIGSYVDNDPYPYGDPVCYSSSFGRSFDSFINIVRVYWGHSDFLPEFRIKFDLMFDLSDRASDRCCPDDQVLIRFYPSQIKGVYRVYCDPHGHIDEDNYDGKIKTYRQWDVPGRAINKIARMVADIYDDIPICFTYEDDGESDSDDEDGDGDDGDKSCEEEDDDTGSYGYESDDCWR